MLAVGISINGSALTGVQTGLQEAVQSIEGTVNNVPFGTILVMFVGLGFVVAWINFLIQAHRRT